VVVSWFAPAFERVCEPTSERRDGEPLVDEPQLNVMVRVLAPLVGGKASKFTFAGATRAW
jgi:hypothetical protein